MLEHQFARNGVQTLQGAANFVDPDHVEVKTCDDAIKTIEGERFLIAVGTRPYRPEHIPFDGKRVFDSDDILEFAALPRSLTVVGAGVIGIEYATIFSRPRRARRRWSSRAPPSSISSTANSSTEFIHELRDRGMAIRLGAQSGSHRSQARLQHASTCSKTGGSMRADMLLYAAGPHGRHRTARARCLRHRCRTTAAV